MHVFILNINLDIYTDKITGNEELFQNNLERSIGNRIEKQSKIKWTISQKFTEEDLWVGYDQRNCVKCSKNNLKRSMQ